MLDLKSVDKEVFNDIKTELCALHSPVYKSIEFV